MNLLTAVVTQTQHLFVLTHRHHHVVTVHHQQIDLVVMLAILVLSAFVGFEVISKVPNTLHTPLMSGTNAIHGIVVVGALVVVSQSSGLLSQILLVIAIAFGTINVVGGFLVTDRMLSMFKRKPEPPKQETSAGEASA
jgi:H+-translocating NAD(P) transhydrogenase subunit alpha